MKTQALPILIVGDVQGTMDARELESLLPDRRFDRRVFSLRRDGDAPLVVRHGPEAQLIRHVKRRHRSLAH